MLGECTSAERPVVVGNVAVACEPAAIQSPTTAELWQSGKYHELASRLAESLAAAEISGDRQELIDSANDLACVKRAAGDHESAAYFQLLAASAERDFPGSRSGAISATSIGNLACDALHAGRQAIAEGLLWRSLLAELATGDEAGTAADWANLGLLAAMRGELEAARTRLWRALKIHRRTGDCFHTGLDLWHLAQLSETMQDWRLASRLYARAANWFAKASHAEFLKAAVDCSRLNAARQSVLEFDASRN